MPISRWPKSRPWIAARSACITTVSGTGKLVGQNAHTPRLLSELALQLTHPGTKISTLGELFQFAKCADPNRSINWNIESKINPVLANATRSVTDFVTLQNKEFVKSGYKLSQITVGWTFETRRLCLLYLFCSTRALIGVHSWG